MAEGFQKAMGGAVRSGEVRVVDLPREESHQGIIDGRVDLFLMPATDFGPRPPLGLISEIVMPRRDPRTVAVTRASPPTPLRELPALASVVCPTIREESLLRVFHPEARIHASSGMGCSVQGAEAALDSVSRGEADAALIPAWQWEINRAEGLGVEYLGRTVWIPAPGEGGTAVVYSISNSVVRSALGPLVDFSARGEIMAELAFAEAVDALPGVVVLAAGLSYGAGLRLWGLLLDSKGKRAVRVDRTGELEGPEPLGWALAADTVARSAGVLS